MNPNPKIESWLTTSLKKSKSDFEAVEAHPLFQTVYAQLDQIDQQAEEDRLFVELVANAREHWPSKDPESDPTEPILALMFEYDYPEAEEVDAAAYGIGKWDRKTIHTRNFEMGWRIDFNRSFEALPGVTLSGFHPLRALDWSELPEELAEDDITEMDGFFPLQQAFQFQVYLTLRKALIRFCETDEFAQLNIHRPLPILIGEHEMSRHPLWVVE